MSINDFRAWWNRHIACGCKELELPLRDHHHDEHR
jgi:hypothetical protein